MSEFKLYVPSLDNAIDKFNSSADELIELAKHYKSQIEVHNALCEIDCKTMECASEWGFNADAELCEDCPMRRRIPDEQI